MNGLAISRRALIAGAVAAATVATGRSALAQTAENRATERAYEISVLESNRDFDRLYDLMHPDAQAFIPREVIVGWYADFLDGVAAEPLTVTGVRILEWVWPVTGVAYPETAEVSYIQPFVRDGVRTEEPEIVRLVDPGDGGGHRWFFGRSREFVDEQIARYTTPVGTGEYELRLLGLLDGFDMSDTNALNNQRLIVGDASPFGEPGDCGYLWENDTLTALHELTNRPGWINYAHDISDSGVIVGGSASFEGAATPYVINGGQYRELPKLPDRIGASVEAINKAGTMAGWSGSHFLAGEASVPARAVIWSDGEIEALPDDDAIASHAFAINESGDIAGAADWGNGLQAVIWISTGIEPLPLYAEGQISSHAMAMNDVSVVGYARFVHNVPGGLPWIWQPGDTALTPLPLPPGVETVHELAINAAGAIVGTAWRGDPTPVGLLWRDGNVDELTQLLDSDAGWTVTAASDINDQGDICGQVGVYGDPHSRVAALFTPRTG